MPSGLIEKQHRVAPGFDLCGDLGKMQAHRFRIAVRQNETCAFSFLGADSAEDIG
jgi:hypothetical protein